MNKIYKVVWNAARNCYVVGSEFISSHTGGGYDLRSSHKQNRKKNLQRLVVASLLAGAALMPSFVMPETAYAAKPGGGQDGNWQIAQDIDALEKENDKQQHQIDMGKWIDHQQNEVIENGIKHDIAQDGLIAGGIVHDAMQDEAIEGGIKHDMAQDGLIAGGIAHDAMQDEAIEGGIKHDMAQDGLIAGGIAHDAMQDEAIEGGIKHDMAQDGLIAGGIIHDVIQDEAIKNEVINREEADKVLQDNIDKVDDKVGDLNYSSHDYVDVDDDTTTAIGKLDDALGEVEYKAQQHTSVSTTDQNIQLSESTNANGGTNYEIALNPNLKVETIQAESGSYGNIQINGKDENGNATDTITGLANTEWNEQIANTVEENKNGEAGTAATQGQLQQAIEQTTQTLTDNSVQYDKNADGTVNKGSVTLGGPNATSPVNLHNVADGTVAEGSTEAVNGGQLWKVQNQVDSNSSAIGNLNNRVDTLDNRIDKVGANAAALAALHPLDFDPDDKWDFAAGYGNFRGENAMAVGAFYRPNEDTMFNVGTTFGTGDNMVNAGVSFKIGQGNHISTSRVAMAKEIKSLQGTVAKLTELVNALVGPQNQVQNEFNKPFPDVPENHWAYEYISKMAKQGIVEGYPDGTFGGDRTMTRYEFATIVYRALQKGLAMNEDVQRLLKEFKPELDLIRVDTIAKDKDGNPTIERVRVNKV